MSVLVHYIIPEVKNVRKNTKGSEKPEEKNVQKKPEGKEIQKKQSMFML